MRAIFRTPEIPLHPKKALAVCLREHQLYVLSEVQISALELNVPSKPHTSLINTEHTANSLIRRELEKERDTREGEMWWRRWGSVIEKETCSRAPRRFDILFIQTSHSALIGQWLRWAKTVSLMSPESVCTYAIHTHCIRLHVSELCANKLQMETRSEQSNRELLIYTRWQSQSSSSSALNLKFHLQPPLNSSTDIHIYRPIVQGLFFNLQHRNANIFVKLRFLLMHALIWLDNRVSQFPQKKKKIW